MIRSVARKARLATHSFLSGSGANRALANARWRQSRVLILCYHGVSLRDEHVWDPELFVTRKFLERRFEMIRSAGYEVMDLGEAVRQLAAGSLPPRAVVLTFDDGFYNFFADVLPLLRQFQFPATVYVPTYHVLNQRPIPLLAARYMAWRCLTTTPATAIWNGRAFGAGDLSLTGRVSREMGEIVQRTAEDHESQLAWMMETARGFGIDWQDFQRERLFHLMTAEETRECARQGVAVELHTHRHRTPRDNNLFNREIIDNKRHLQEITGRAPTHFCYPSGDVDPMFLPLLAGQGVETATTCKTGMATPASSALLLPRFIDTMSQSEATFDCWLSGAASLLP